MGFMQGFLGNMSEVTQEQLYQQYGQYLMEGERIVTGFKLIRDVMIITDRRILEFDKQGATGQKMRVNSIYLNSIFNVSAETAGFGIDDSELEIYYIATPYLKAHGIQYASKKYEFPKKYNIQGLYKMLQEYAYANYMRLNG
ncbi:MAG: PH domain-containing protein [Clostridia bacterium]|nr:PH domain-containing protein [Clostridia bacterium]